VDLAGCGFVACNRAANINSDTGVDEMAMHKRISRFFPMAMIPLALGVAPQLSWAEEHEAEFDVAELFFELNNTDGDLGIHALIDGGPWKKLQIEDKREREILDVTVKGRLRRQGLTEIFFESAEPTFDQLLPRKFFRRFPAGTYEIEGTTLDGVGLENEVELTHVIPAPHVPTVNEMSAAEQCDEDEPGYDATVTSAPVIIAWAPVTMSHPKLGVHSAVTIHNYEVVVEVELNDEFASTMHVVLPPGETSMTIPEEFIAQGDEFKYEVLAREESFNQTAIESCFVLD